jgi:predicted 2-oxoglutarate/Fe(II)-dependent dioxygenase YbiX
MKTDDIKLFDLLLHIPNYMSKRDCESLIKHYNEVESAKSSYYERSTTPQGIHKASSFKCIELADPHSIELNMLRFAVIDLVKKYRDYLDSFNSFHVHNIRKSAFNYVHKYRILKYTEGASIHAHSDHAPYGYGSCTINLNEDYEGGEFSFFNGKNEIKLKQGDAILFPADHYWVHEVKPIISGTRYSFNCFLNKLHVEVMNNLNDLAEKFGDNPACSHYVGEGVNIVSEEELKEIEQNMDDPTEKPTNIIASNVEYK